MSKLIIFMLTVLFMPFASAASSLTPEEAARKSDGIWVYEDKTNSLSAQDVISKADQFAERQDTHIGITDSTWWVKIPYDSQRINEVLVVNNFWIAEVDLFYQQENEVKTVRSGWHVPYVDQQRVTPLIIFPQISSNPNVDFLYLRYKTDDVLNLGFEFQNTELAQANEFVFFALVIGALAIAAALLIYNLLLGFISRDGTYWIYVLYMGSALLHIFSAGGGLRLVPSLTELTPTIAWIFGMLAFVFGLWLLSRVLADCLTPIIHGVIRIGWLAGGLQVLSALVLDQQTLTKLSGPLVAVVSVCMLVVLGRAIYVRHMLAPWLTIGWGLATLGLVSTVLTIHNTIHEPLYFLAVQFGFVVEGITFSAALAVRLRQKDVEMASANTRAREQQKRLLEAQKHELELQALVDELQMAKDKQAHMFSIIDAQNNRLNQALDFAGMWLFEENLSNGTGEVIRSQNTHEDEEFLVGPARLAATDEEYRSKIVDKLSRIGESVDFPLNFGQDSRKWVRNMTIAEYTDAAGNTIRLQLSQDITEFREQQNSLELANKELKDRSEKQAQIFSIIGHELRTPLASIKMMEDAMGLRNIGEYGANICDSTDAVLNIVDDLRTVINPEKVHQAQAVVDSPFDVLSRTIGSLEGLYLQHNVDVEVTSNQLSHCLCKFNAQALRQKITNLTKNAAIHADADSVWVDLQAQPRADEKIDLTLIVEDNGKGIPEGLREAVFGAFSRGDTRADGTGLGLYITRELAEKLGGTVEYFESEKGGAGFKVEFTLDLHLDANEQEQVEAAIPVALQGKRILLVEDQNTLQLLTSKLLKDAGAEVVVCDNGKQALDAFRAGEFDIVLTDLMMPEMSGDELIRHIRADGFTGQVFALTAAIIGKETDKLLEAGADAVLNKPLDIHDMKRTIAGLATKDSAS